MQSGLHGEFALLGAHRVMASSEFSLDGPTINGCAGQKCPAAGQMWPNPPSRRGSIVVFVDFERFDSMRQCTQRHSEQARGFGAAAAGFCQSIADDLDLVRLNA